LTLSGKKKPTKDPSEAVVPNNIYLRARPMQRERERERERPHFTTIKQSGEAVWQLHRSLFL